MGRTPNFKNLLKMQNNFLKKSKKYRGELKRYIKRNFGKKCGHIGKDEISLDCAVCKYWLAYEFLSWLVDDVEFSERKK